MKKPSLLLVSLLALSSSGCAVLGVFGNGPMRSVQPVKNAGAKCLVVLLPGQGDAPEVFEKEGIAQLLRASGASVDVIAADASLAYYRSGNFVERLREDVIGPAREKGEYEQLWLMGVSMGGFGSLTYAAQREGDVEGIFAVAPWLGDDALVTEIREAGGLQSWKSPEKAPFDQDNYQRQLWRWLQEMTAKSPSAYPAIHLGYGEIDRLAAADSLVAEALPDSRVFVAPGAHRWIVWKTIFERFLAESAFTKTCAPN